LTRCYESYNATVLKIGDQNRIIKNMGIKVYISDYCLYDHMGHQIEIPYEKLNEFVELLTDLQQKMEKKQ